MDEDTSTTEITTTATTTDGTIDEDYDIIDEDGEVIDAAAEGSYLMAEGMLEMARAETGEDFIIVQPYVPDFDVAAVQAQADCFFERRNDIAARTTAEARDEKKDTPSTGDEVRTDNDTDFYDGDEFEEDTFQTMGSRDMTDPDDWKLQAILRRKLNNEKEGGLWLYLCKWVGYDDPTWETREVMEDAGWIPQLDSFDTRGNQKTMSLPRLAIPDESHVRNAKILESFFGATDAEISSHLLNVINQARIKTPQLYPPNFTIMRYCRMNAALATPFLERWESCRSTHVPTIVYHGTRAKNFKAIYHDGLVVGGTKNVKVVNGKVHGYGVYTSPSPVAPMSYSDTSNALIVCIGLVPIDEKCQTVFRTSSHYLIFREPKDVYPMWLVQFDGTDRTRGLTSISTTEFIAQSLKCFGPQKMYKVPKSHPSSDSKSELMLEEEARAVDRALSDLKDAKGNIKKAALRGQPRRIKDLIHRAAAERYKIDK